MAIRKRGAADAAIEAQIDQFGDAAEAAEVKPAVAPEAKAPSTASRTARVAPPPATAKVPKTFLLRWPDEDLPLLLAEVAAREERSQHAIALRAMRRGLEAMKNDAPGR